MQVVASVNNIASRHKLYVCNPDRRTGNQTNVLISPRVQDSWCMPTIPDLQAHYSIANAPHLLALNIYWRLVPLLSVGEQHKSAQDVHLQNWISINSFLELELGWIASERDVGVRTYRAPSDASRGGRSSGMWKTPAAARPAFRSRRVHGTPAVGLPLRLVSAPSPSCWPRVKLRRTNRSQLV